MYNQVASKFSSFKGAEQFKWQANENAPNYAQPSQSQFVASMMTDPNMNHPLLHAWFQQAAAGQASLKPQPPFAPTMPEYAAPATTEFDMLHAMAGHTPRRVNAAFSARPRDSPDVRVPATLFRYLVVLYVCYAM
jgi:hypothetical protein